MLSIPETPEATKSRLEYKKLIRLIDEFNAAKANSTEELSLLQQIDFYTMLIIEGQDFVFKTKNPLFIIPLREAILKWRNQNIFTQVKEPPTRFEQMLQRIRLFIPSLRESFHRWRQQNTSSTPSTGVKEPSVLEEEPNRPARASFEQVLQRVGVHRDASVLLRSVEYASAYRRLESESSEKEFSEINAEAGNAHLYFLLEKRYFLLKELLELGNNPEEQTLTNKRWSLTGQLHQTHLELFQLIQACPAVKELVTEHSDILAQSYAEIEVIFDKVEQEFPTYSVSPLTKEKVNNDNSLFTIDNNNKKIQLVIRLEDRDNHNNEVWLQSTPVSKFFTKDYATVIKQFTAADKRKSFRPVVISQYASEGNLKEAAARISIEQTDLLLEKAKNYFSQISQFCKELMTLGVYYPDIKLTNFLLDQDKIIISDRKAFVNKRHVIANDDIRTSPLYSPPELLKCLNKKNTGFRFKGSKDPIDLIPYMSFQIGIALKTFLLRGESPSNIIKYDLFYDYKNPSDTHRNLAILSEALTRKNPQDRISLDVFSIMLEQISLDHQQFLNVLQRQTGRDVFAEAKKIRALIEDNETNETDLDLIIGQYINCNLLDLDHDVEESLISLCRVKYSPESPTHQFANKTLAIKAAVNKLAFGFSLNSPEVRHLYHLIEETKICLKDNLEKGTLAAKLLSNTIQEVEKDYDEIFQRVEMQLLTVKIKNNETLMPSQVERVNFFLNKYLTRNFNKDPSLFGSAFRELRKASFSYIENAILAHSAKQASGIETFLAWLGIRPLSFKVTFEEMSETPSLQNSHRLLDKLDVAKREKFLAGNKELMNCMIAIYGGPNSHDKMKKLNRSTSQKELPTTNTTVKADTNTSSIIVMADESTTNISEKTLKIPDSVIKKEGKSFRYSS